MTAVYAPILDGAGYDDLRAATLSIDARLRQSNLLASKRTLLTRALACQFAAWPLPGTLTRVVIVDPGARVPDGYTAEQALTLNGAALAIDDADLSVGQTVAAAGGSVGYIHEGTTAIRFTSAVAARALVLADGLFGYGRRVSIRASGNWGPLSADPDQGWQHTGGTALPVGTTIQWDDEVMAVRAVDEGADARTYTLDRDAPQPHSDTGELWRLDPPGDLRWACGVLAKRMADVEAKPAAGAEFNAAGDPTPSLYRNLEGALRAYYRPVTA